MCLKLLYHYDLNGVHVKKCKHSTTIDQLFYLKALKLVDDQNKIYV